MAILRSCIRDVPSAFNSQTARMSLHIGSEHQALWDITAGCLRNLIGQDRYVKGGTDIKMSCFANSCGTILFWDDLSRTVSDNDAPKATLSVDEKALEWAHQSSGMHQYYMWTVIESFPNMGANLQHYNPVIDTEVKLRWDIPEQWVLKAQMVFGEKDGTAELERKQQHSSVDERIRIFGL
jgi:uncharacterized protein